ncbi:hypothetical protein ACI2K4_23045 [Micromonospora sp. NPDC050397]|uniref:hypothetical protein n=1 Tax=Micromonospora sp. NPDC050397 TaxID=3364279 RepID=UPI00384D3B56
MRTEVSTLDLEPESKKLVRVTITVPETASAGERYAAVWAQVTPPPSADSNVGQIRRVGVRVYLDIGPGGEPVTDFRVDGLAMGPPSGNWPVQPLPDGRWDAELVLVSGTVEGTVRARLTLPGPVGALVAEPDGRSVPLLAVAAGVLLAAVLTGFVWYLVRRRFVTRSAG